MKIKMYFNGSMKKREVRLIDHETLDIVSLHYHIRKGCGFFMGIFAHEDCIRVLFFWD